MARTSIRYKDVECSLVEYESEGVWCYSFRIDHKVVSGRTETRLEALAKRRAQMRIDREIKSREQR
ncbi:MAG: hypothetical protein JOY90_00810 [Bradyrhizobium sp.]|uniref:hypothetical protein n=1 Tax=Bradyrhizobium sp. TaxID=376 RepID=UPI001D263F61|nr:hypothetical protein [Bradyrhizobium sp.]MBV9558995.1 hypothetical protein [Bradyrhizobium sp.]